MKKLNIITWIALIALTIASFLFSEGKFSGRSLVLFLMLITIVKFSAIGMQFIGLRHAHFVWRILFVSFIMLFAVLVVGFV
jgi:cytochrome c oxidase subunit IV